MSAKKYFHITLQDKPTYVLGDLHGAVDTLRGGIKSRKLSDCNLIIAGDIGLGFSSYKVHLQEYQYLNKFLQSCNIELIVLRGNHDDPAYFNRDTNIDEHFLMSNVKVIPDYTVVSVNRENALLIGGATSIDRKYRIRERKTRINQWLSYHPKLTYAEADNMFSKGYWEGEQPFLSTDSIDELTEDGILISTVITHTCPSFAFPQTKKGVEEWMAYDNKLADDLDKERGTMDAIYAYLKDKGHEIKEWVYGHYHTHHQSEYENVIFTTLYNTDRQFDAHEIARKDDIYL